MVDGCKKKGCVVVDLDNTLLRCNSTKKLSFFLVGKLIAGWRFNDLGQVGFALIKRKLGLIPHRILKHTILKSARKNFSADDIDLFAQKLIGELNETVCGIISDYTDCRVLIATAATDMFMQAFVKKLPFKADFSASAYTDDAEKYVDNLGRQKLKSVEEYLNEKDCVLTTFITDHRDDLPLLKHNKGRNFLVKPSKKTLKVLRKEGVTEGMYEIIK